MQKIDNGLFIKLLPEEGYVIYSQHTNSYHSVVYLGKNDDEKFYLEVVDPNKPEVQPDSQAQFEQLLKTAIDIINE